MNVLYKGHPSFHSPEVLSRIIISLVAVVAFSAMILFLGNQGILPQLFVVLGILLVVGGGAGFPLLWRKAHLYIVNERGVRSEFGFLIRSHTRELAFRRIQVVDVHQNIFEKLIFHTGTIHVDTAAGDNAHDLIAFKGISNPRRVEAILREGEDNTFRHGGDDEFYNPYREERRGPQQPQGPAPWERPAPWDRSGESSGAAAPWDRPDDSAGYR